MKNNFSSDMWILDSGAGCHYCQSAEGLTDVKEIDESIKIGNGNSMKSAKIRNLKCEVTQVNGEKLTITLNDVKYVPSLCVNLFSLNKALKKGFNVSNDGVVISLNYKHVKLTFGRVIHATDDCVTGVLMKTILSDIINGFANASISTKRSMINIISAQILSLNSPSKLASFNIARIPPQSVWNFLSTFPFL
jgi:hypothetical protein